MSDLLRTLSAVCRRKGSPRMSKHAFKHALSLDLRWFAPADAKRLLEHAVALGLLQEDGEDVELAFDPAEVEVPLAFKPTLAALEEQPEAPAGAAPPVPVKPGGDLLSRVARAIGEVTGQGSEAALHEVDVLDKKLAGAFTREVTALLVAHRRGVDVAPFVGEAYEGLRKTV